MNWPQVYVCPPDPEPTSHFFSHPIPLGCPRALALGALFHTLNLHWPCVLHMIVYMFQCYSLKSSHLCLFPLSPKVCSLHLCLPCCPACRITGTIFLNSICVNTQDLAFCFCLTSLCIIGSRFIYLIRTDSNEFFLTAE